MIAVSCIVYNSFCLLLLHKYTVQLVDLSIIPHKTICKDKFVFSAVPIPQDCSKRFILYSLTYLFNHYRNGYQWHSIDVAVPSPSATFNLERDGLHASFFGFLVRNVVGPLD